MKKAALLLLIVASSWSISGCWDRKEINDVAFVMGTAIDLEDKQYKITVQFPLPGQLGGIGGAGGGGGTSGSKSWYQDSAVAEVGRIAVEAQQASISRALYFGHRRVILLGEELARQGVADVLDATARVPQNRLTSFIVITKGPAGQLMNVSSPIEQFPTEVVRELAQISMKEPQLIRQFTANLLSEGIDPVLPALSVKKVAMPHVGSASMKIVMDSLAIFRDDKLVGLMPREQASGVLWAMNQARRPSLAVDVPEGKGQLVVQFQENTVHLEPLVVGKKITMRIHIKAKGSVMENKSNFEATAAANIERVEKVVTEKLKQQVEASVKVLQTEYRADSIGFGNALRRWKSEDWQRLRPEWDTIYPTVAVVVEPEVHIEGTGSLLKPLGRTEGDLSS